MTVGVGVLVGVAVGKAFEAVKELLSFDAALVKRP